MNDKKKKTKEFKYKTLQEALKEANILHYKMSYDVHSIVKYGGVWVVTYSD